MNLRKERKVTNAKGDVGGLILCLSRGWKIKEPNKNKRKLNKIDIIIGCH